MSHVEYLSKKALCSCGHKLEHHSLEAVMFRDSGPPWGPTVFSEPCNVIGCVCRNFLHDEWQEAGFPF
jgi:hypothetical protein